MELSWNADKAVLHLHTAKEMAVTPSSFPLETLNFLDKRNSTSNIVEKRGKPVVFT